MEAQIRNFVGIDRLDLKMDGIALVCGRNEQGKTSTLRAIAAALTRSACPVVLPGSTEEKMKEAFAKKDFKELVRNGTDKASVAIVSESGTVTVEWPSGAVGEQGKPPQASIYAAGILRYGELPDTAKQVLLAKVAGAEPTFEDWKGECTDKGFSDAMTLRVWQQIQAEGWALVEKSVRENGALLKGQWKEVTQEGNWGSQKGEDWAPKGMHKEDISACQVILAHQGKAAIDDAIAQAEAWHNAKIAEAQAEVDAAIGRSAVDADMRAQLEQTIAAGRAVDVAEHLGVVADLEAQERAQQAERDALPTASYSTLPCPWEDCGKPIEVVQVNRAERRIVKGDAKPSDKELKARREAIARKDAQLEGTLQMLATARAALSSAEAAVVQAAQAELKLKAAESPSDGTALETARARLTEAQTTRDQGLRYVRAHRLHRQILTNAKWLELIEPEGARKTVLLRKIKPLNERLKYLCETAKCGIVRIRPDREIEAETDAGAVPYQLLSESAAMRADTMMQIAIAEMDKSDVLVIDRFDKFDGPNRRDMLNAIMASGIPAVIGCTYTNDKLPPRLPVNFGRTYWLDAGVGRVLDPNEAKAA